jgi:hypothetical protein
VDGSDPEPSHVQFTNTENDFVGDDSLPIRNFAVVLSAV